MKVPNWSEFQHYKQRNPPWIKLHRQLLDNSDFAVLPLASRALAPFLWLLASESKTGGELPSVSAMAWRLRTSESELREALEPLVRNRFIDDASAELAQNKQETTPSRGEGEEEEEKRDVYAHASDEESDDIDFEESRLMGTLVALRNSGADVQAICDSLERPKGQAPFNAFRAFIGGKSGIPRTTVGLTVRRRLNDALEARQRAQAAPIISANNQRAFEAADRVLARFKAQQSGLPVREIEG